MLNGYFGLDLSTPFFVDLRESKISALVGRINVDARIVIEHLRMSNCRQPFKSHRNTSLKRITLTRGDMGQRVPGMLILKRVGLRLSFSIVGLIRLVQVSIFGATLKLHFLTLNLLNNLHDFVNVKTNLSSKVVCSCAFDFRRRVRQFHNILIIDGLLIILDSLTKFALFPW